MTTHELCAAIEAFAPLSLQDNWDNSGLQIDNNNAEVTGVLICLDITEKSIQEAMDKGCNVIVAHHPLIFAPIKKIGNENYVERCISKAISNGIAIYANHTPIDKVKGGSSWLVGEQLGLQDCTYLQTEDAASYGIVGNLPTTMTSQSFIDYVKQQLGLTMVRCSEPTLPTIERVAICGGSGAFLINSAKQAGAQAYICGDLKHHEYFQAEGKLLLMDVGHFESEIATKEIFFSILSKKIPTFVVHLSENDKSPIYCL